MCGAVLLRAVRADSIIRSCSGPLGEWEPKHKEEKDGICQMIIKSAIINVKLCCSEIIQSEMLQIKWNLIAVHSNNNHCKITWRLKSCSFKQLPILSVAYVFTMKFFGRNAQERKLFIQTAAIFLLIFLEKCELLHSFKLACLTHWAIGELRK